MYYVEYLVEAPGVGSIIVSNDTRQNLSVCVAVLNQRGNVPHCRGSLIIILDETENILFLQENILQASAYPCFSKKTETELAAGMSPPSSL
jgi:hypothetical protein